MSEAQNFLDNATAGNVPLAEIDDFVEKWHAERARKNSTAISE